MPDYWNSEIMLPELLFSVGTSMQDISRDDYGLLKGTCEKDVIIARSTPPISSTPPAMAGGYHHRTDTPPSATLGMSHLDPVSIKLEDSTSELYPPSWHHPHHPEIGSSKLLLRNSDDPLISRGASTVDDDNPNELNSIVAAAASMTKSNVNSTITPPSNTNASPKRSKNASTTNRTRRKGAFKLRFHHQALPAEYLSHYEATQNQSKPKNSSSNNNNSSISNNNHNISSNNHNSSSKTSGSVKKSSEESQLNSMLVRKQASNAQSNAQSNAHETVRNWLQKISGMQNDTNETKEPIDSIDDSIQDSSGVQTATPNARKSPRRVVNYSDLPYMGEMTLENSKPRRGRKPKKADICHLIYKNYGTIFPGTPKNLMEAETKGEARDATSSPGKTADSESKSKSMQKSKNGQTEEPLNLCLRDQSTDSLTISSDDDDTDELPGSNRTTPVHSPSDAVTDALLAANLKMSLPNFQSALMDKSSDDTKTPSTAESDQNSSNYVYWPQAGVFIHPVALYYQKMLDARSPDKSAEAVVKMEPPPSPKPNQPSPKPILKSLSQLVKKEKMEPPEPCSTPSSVKSTSSSATASGTSSGQRPQPPQKRKRSAIFIPPMPAENTTNPATEVSICKFKFTGGAKPSLQEKKMLSVDSDGNYRFYSGTGDKSMRGYEFFPRESLQQSGGIPGVNCPSVFMSSSSSEKTNSDLPPPSVGLSNELLQIPDSPPSSLILPHSQTMTAPTGSDLHMDSQNNNDRRKRKSRRSLQREKLEQTFKEKGFLIQTQQLESAEGATYCKFRQLRKFTRYLFRSWKDYLPGELQQANAAAAASGSAGNGVHAASVEESRRGQERNMSNELPDIKPVMEKR